jgi:20S proteasome alpha/beta subunit
MTVCIGLVCEGGKYILLAADTRATYGSASSNDQMSKMFDLPAKYYGAIAGTGSQCEDVVSELYHEMAQITDTEIAPEQARQCINVLMY